MLLQTNSYIVPKDKRTEHARLVARFRQVLARLGCDHFEAYEQVGANWAAESTGRFVQIMRFRDRKHQQAVQAAERGDPAAQQLIKEFCELINFPYQQQQGLFAVGFYTSVLAAPARLPPTPPVVPAPPAPSAHSAEPQEQPPSPHPSHAQHAPQSSQAPPHAQQRAARTAPPDPTATRDNGEAVEPHERETAPASTSQSPAVPDEFHVEDDTAATELNVDELLAEQDEHRTPENDTPSDRRVGA